MREYNHLFLSLYDIEYWSLNKNMHSHNPKHRLIFWVSTVLALLAFVSLNIYLPSLPAIQKNLLASALGLKLSITLFLIGFALSQFFWGSFSAKYGRKKLVILGLIIADLGSMTAMLAPNIFIFDTARLFEGLGIGAAGVLCRAMLTDTFDSHELSKALSYVGSLGNVMPALAPIMGGYIILAGSWRLIFLILIIYTSALIFVFFFSVHETNQKIQKDFGLKSAMKEYGHILSNRTFMTYFCPVMMLSGGMVGYYAATPFIFISYLHISAQHYSFLSITTVTTYVLGAQSSNFLNKKLGLKKTVFCGLLLSFVAFILALILNFTTNLNALSVILPMAIYTLGAGLVAPIASGHALSTVRHVAGAAAAVFGGLVYGMSAISTLLFTSMDLSKLSSLATYLGILSLLALGLFCWLARERSKKIRA